MAVRPPKLPKETAQTILERAKRPPAKDAPPGRLQKHPHTAKYEEIKKANVMVRRNAALELRLEGKDYRTIGELLGYSHEAARLDIQAALEELSAEQSAKADVLRQEELETLNRYKAVVNGLLESSDAKARLAAVDRGLRISQRRAQLLGLDAPVKVEVREESFSDFVRRVKAGGGDGRSGTPLPDAD